MSNEYLNTKMNMKVKPDQFNFDFSYFLGKKDDDVSLSESEKFLADVVQHHQNENINIA